MYNETKEYFNHYSLKRVGERLANVSLGDHALLNPVCRVIPTVALFTGINTQDYSNFTENLADKLRVSLTKHLFVVSEKNAQNIKSLTNSVMSQWEKCSVRLKRKITF